MVATYPGCDVVRKVLGVSRVDLGKIPQWLTECLKLEYPETKLLETSEGQSRALTRLMGKLSLDHCGTTDWHDIPSCFVTEPYDVDAEGLVELRKKGRRLGFAVAYDAVSYYYPGSCHRIVMFPCSTRLNSQSHPAALLALVEEGAKVEI